MSLSNEHRATMIAATREAAAALVEDLEYLRLVLSRPEITRAEVRRISAILRRLLVERSLASVATPRVGKLVLRAPDNRPLYAENKTKPYVFCSSAGAPLFGLVLRACMVREDHPSSVKNAELDRFVDLRIDTFLTQQVLCWEGRWVSRAAAIKFIANIADGVHSGAPTTDEDKIIQRMRRTMSIGRAHEKTGYVLFHPSVLTNEEGELSLHPDKVDPVLVEVIAAAFFMTQSPAVIGLETKIKAELYPPPRQRS